MFAIKRSHLSLPPAGRNQLCPCDSGKKHKHCCLQAHNVQSLTKRSPPGAPTNASGLIAQAMLAEQAGNLPLAIKLLRRSITREPLNSSALHHLGLVLFDGGDVRAALELLHKSVVLSPHNAGFLSNYGAILHRAGRHEQAAFQLKRALEINPDLPDTHFSLGHVYLSLSRPAEAAVELATAVQQRPDFADATNSLGVTCVQLGSHQRAIVCYLKALALQPGHAAANANLGASLLALGRFSEALAPLQCALQLDPNLVKAHISLGSLYLQIGEYDKAIAHCETVLSLNPGNIHSFITLGNVYRDQGLLKQAAATFRRVIDLDPGYLDAHNNLAETYRDLGDIDAAVESYQHALALQPDYANANSNLPYLHAFAEDIPPAETLAEARKWEKRMLSAESRAEARRWARPRSASTTIDTPGFTPHDLAGGKLRLGIVSPELGTHPVAEFLEPFLQNLDRERFHLTLFSTRHHSCQRSGRLRALADDFVPLIGCSDTEAVNLIRAKAIDVLLDTSGHTASNRLGIFARRAAPVQCTYIGYWSTTGLTEIDWFLSDPDAPQSIEPHFSEGLWRLPRISVCYGGDTTLDATAWQPDPSGIIWLGSFNKFSKMREETFDLWAKVLHALPEGQLLLEDRGSDETDSHNRIREGIAAHGIHPNRIHFIPYVPGHERHMLLYNRVDIALDTIPFNSGTTAFDALWMGVPLVALEGVTIGSRMAASILRSLGRPEWIASTPERYATIVLDLARGVTLRRKLRVQQRQSMAASPLCDAVGLSHALQNAFQKMYMHWASGNAEAMR